MYRTLTIGVDQVEGPRFTDGCSHGDKCYVGTVRDVSASPPVDADVYVFDDNGQQSVCIRYGNEGHEYYSPGKLMQFVKSAIMHGHRLRFYELALSLLTGSGKFVWTKNKETQDAIK